MRNYLNLNFSTAVSEATAKISTDQCAAAFSRFPGGEVHCRLMGRVPETITINCRIQSSDDLMCLLLATDALRRNGAKDISVFIPYMPYARQDRVCSPGEALSAKVMAGLLNAQNYSAVMSCDIHSSVMAALVDNFSDMLVIGHIKAALEEVEKPVLVSPDAGATKRVERIASHFGIPSDRIMQARKVRDDKGVTSVVGGMPIKENYLIVDDICDGGATFIALAERIREIHEEAKVYLCVTHGIFSKGIDRLLEPGRLDGIYTTNSFVPATCTPEKLKKINITTL